MKLKVKKLHPDAKIPSYAHPGDAGMDLCCIEAFTMNPGDRKSVPTGISIEIPHGCVALVWDKSGLSHKHGIKTTGGVIDEGFRGEVHIGLINLSSEKYHFEKGNKIAQLLIQKIEHVEIEEAIDLSETARGHNWLGSTGK